MWWPFKIEFRWFIIIINHNYYNETGLRTNVFLTKCRSLEVMLRDKALKWNFILPCSFNGVTVRPKHLMDIVDSDSFNKRLIKSLDMWQHEGKRGIWIKIPITQADFIPIAAKVYNKYYE